MKKRRFNAVLSLLMVVSLVLGQPAVASAEDMADVTLTEEGNGIVTEDEENPVEGEDETVSGTDDTIDTETGNEEEIGDKVDEEPQTPDEDDQQTEGEEAVNPDEDAMPSDTDADVNDETDTGVSDDVKKVDNSLFSSLDIKKSEILDEYGFSTMSLTTEMVIEKADLAEVVKTMKSMQAGEDYIENEIVYTADSEELAENIAECYGGTLLEYDYGVAAASIEQNVYDAVKIAADMEISIPAIYPNIIYRLESDTEETYDKTAFSVIDGENLYSAKPTDPDFNKQWHHNAIDTLEAWDAATGEGVTVALLDSGIQYDHPDLADNISKHLSVIDGDTDGKDTDGHGTHCAGIIAALKNGAGVVGVAPDAKIVSIKVTNSEGSIETKDLIQGIKLAVEEKVDIISMSLGSFCYDALTQKEIDKAVNAGIVPVAAAGNGKTFKVSGDNTTYAEGTDQKTYPAAYNNVISVAAAEYDEDYDNYYLTFFSNYGSWVDIAAPGDSIYSTIPSSSYGNKSGTSMACPIVTATVALMLSNNETLKNTNTKAGVTKITKTLLSSTGANVAYGYYDTKTYPLVNAEAAVYSVEDGNPDAPTIKFNGQEPDSKNTVQAGEGTDKYFEFVIENPEKAHGKIYYTINGKKPTAKTGIRYYSGTKLSMRRSGKVKIQAVTVWGTKTSKVYSKTFNFDAKITNMTPVDSDSKFTVVKGKSIQLNVNIIPSYASNQKLDWNIENDTTGGMIKVNKTGKVTCNKKANAGTTAVIVAKAKDGSEKELRYTVEVADTGLSGLKLKTDKVNMSYWAQEGYVANPAAGYYYAFPLVVENEGAVTDQYLYKSSNIKVATVDSNGVITAHAKGKAKITVTANDGSGKKAVCNVTVVNPVLSIEAKSSTGFINYIDNDFRGEPDIYSNAMPIGNGCTISMKTVLNYGSKSTYYVPSNTKLTWESSNSDVITAKNGKIKCNKNAIPGTSVTVTVTAQDDWKTSLKLNFVVTEKIEKIYMTDKSGKEYTAAIYDGLPVQAWVEDFWSAGYLHVKTARSDYKNVYYPYVTSSFSNKDVACSYYYMPENRWGILGTKPGTTKVTYTALDGSNKKFTLTVKVVAESKSK